MWVNWITSDEHPASVYSVITYEFKSIVYINNNVLIQMFITTVTYMYTRLFWQLLLLSFNVYTLAQYDGKTLHLIWAFTLNLCDGIRWEMYL